MNLVKLQIAYQQVHPFHRFRLYRVRQAGLSSWAASSTMSRRSQHRPCPTIKVEKEDVNQLRKFYPENKLRKAI